ncbi:MAG TPA: glycogen synthase GlgA [Burkholderiales bacterium]|nr:glycogen synthase GlgA [Burkholderiales bacterium]
MRVLFVTPECAPLTKTGGLGDVSAALPAALRALRLDVRVLLPGYPEVLAGLASAAEAARVREIGLEARILESGAFLVLDCPPLYRRDGGPYQDAEGQDRPDNALRFGLLAKTAARLGGAASPLGWRPDVVHLNDWPAALAAAYLHFGDGGRAATLLTVHNLAFQGNFPAELLARLELPAASFTLDGVEFHGQLSFLKGGLAYADAISTVSPRYASEIQGEALGCGLDGLLRRRRAVLTGILNGIDTEAWDPRRDPHLAERYDASCLERKAVNKTVLQRRMGLEAAAALPVLGMVGRLTHQKGVDLLVAAAGALAALPAQLAVLGTGSREYEAALRSLAARHPGRIGVAIGFDEALAHLIEAGSDLFLMPSRFEPCGLNQMYSLRYGTPPVARATGGLADTIAHGETGFLFERAEGAALAEAVRDAVAAWRDTPRWRTMQRAGMARDFSWSGPARRYADLYSGLVSRAPP